MNKNFFLGEVNMLEILNLLKSGYLQYLLEKKSPTENVKDTCQGYYFDINMNWRGGMYNTT